MENRINEHFVGEPDNAGSSARIVSNVDSATGISVTGEVTTTGGSSTLDDLSGEAFTAIALNPLTYYCIHPKDPSAKIDGEVFTLESGHEITLTDIQGKRLFLATADAMVEGNNFDRHTTIHFESIDTATIKATDNDLIFSIFYEK